MKYLFLITIFVVCCVCLIKCSEQIRNYCDAENLIIGGSNASSSMFPYFVSIIGLRTKNTTLCGGTLISNQFVMTVANCLEGLDLFSIGMGSIYLLAPQISVIATKTIIHPNYNSKTLENNIGLIKLPIVVPMNSNIQPINLNPDSTEFLDRKGLILGYGQQSSAITDITMLLKYASVTIISNINCKTYFDDNQYTSSTLCTQGIYYDGIIKAPCHSDRGGPLIMNDEYNNPIQIGIISQISTDGCSSGYPALYVRVDNYLSWILENT